MTTAILFRNVIGSEALITATPAAVDTMPASLLLDPQPSVRAGFPGSDVAIVADLGGAHVVEAVALISTTLSPGATIRVRLSSDDAGGEAGDVWDTGIGAAETGDEAAGNVIALRPDAGTDAGGDLIALDFLSDSYVAPAPPARFLRIDLSDPGAPMIDVGRIVAGRLWRPTQRHAVGGREGRIALDRRDQNPITGAQFVVPAIANPRFVEWRLPLLTRGEVAGEARSMIAQLGAAGDALWIPDTGLPRAELNLRCIWGGTAQAGEDLALEQVSQARFARACRMVERV